MLSYCRLRSVFRWFFLSQLLLLLLLTVYIYILLWIDLASSARTFSTLHSHVFLMDVCHFFLLLLCVCVCSLTHVCISTGWLYSIFVIFFPFVLCTLRNFMRLISMLAKRQQHQQQINLFRLRSIHFILKFSICCFWRCHCFVVISSYIWVYICIYTVLQTSPYYSSTAHSAIQVSKTYTLVWLVLDIFSFCLLLFYSMCIRVCALFSSPVRASIQFSTKKRCGTFVFK